MPWNGPPTCYRRTQLIRCLRLMTFLAGRRTRPSYRDLGERFGVSYKTIERDLKALEEAHIAVPPARARYLRLSA